MQQREAPGLAAEPAKAGSRKEPGMRTLEQRAELFSPAAAKPR